MAVVYSYAVINWLINDKETVFSSEDQHFLRLCLETVLCTDTPPNIHLLHEHFVHWAKLARPTTACEPLSLPCVLEHIQTAENKGVYPADPFLTPQFWARVLLPGANINVWYDGVVGCVLSAMRQQFVREKMHTSQSSLAGNVAIQCRRVQYIITKLAPSCKYEKTGDNYITAWLLTKLALRRQVLIPQCVTPYDGIAAQYSKDANDLVRPHLDTSPDVKIHHVQWQNTHDLDGFLFVIGVLAEHLDNLQCHILSNGDVPKGMYMDIPYFFLFSSQCDVGMGDVFGCGYKENLYLAPAENPHTSTILLYLQLLAGPSCPSSVCNMKQACEAPDTVPITSSLYTMCEQLLVL